MEKYYKKKCEKHGVDINNLRLENPVEQVTFFAINKETILNCASLTVSASVFVFAWLRTNGKPKKAEIYRVHCAVNTECFRLRGTYWSVETLSENRKYYWHDIKPDWKN